LVFHRDTWNNIGEFDTEMKFMFEDIDWCCRLRRAGGRVLVYQELQILHEAHQSLGGRSGPERVYYWARNGTIFVGREGKDSRRATARWVLSELRSAIDDLAGGKLATSAARLKGLVSGLRASRQGSPRQVETGSLQPPELGG
jgi:GT2 family glycosyltransferase